MFKRLFKSYNAQDLLMIALGIGAYAFIIYATLKAFN